MLYLVHSVIADNIKHVAFIIIFNIVNASTIWLSVVGPVMRAWQKPGVGLLCKHGDIDTNSISEQSGWEDIFCWVLQMEEN